MSTAASNAITSLEEFDRFLASTTDRPRFFFKHSTRCPVSTRALDQYEDFLDSAADAEAHVYLDLIAHRDVSNAVAERSGIAHESPQAILFAGGKAVWNASHGRITKATLAAALAEHGG